MPDFDELGRMVCQQVGAQKAYKMAGIKDPRKELDLIETHDLLTGVELISYKNLVEGYGSCNADPAFHRCSAL